MIGIGIPGVLANLSVALVTLIATWLVGNYITTLWDEVRKRREFELAALNDLYKVYGDFFSLIKLWSMHYRRPKYTFEISEVARHELVERAAATEARLEAFIVKITAERQLAVKDRDLLGAFRQACQSIRQSIASDADLGWHSDRAPGYLHFKALASWAVTSLIGSPPRRVFWRRPEPGPSAWEASEALQQITSNMYENRWQQIAQSHRLIAEKPSSDALNRRLSQS
ncbi:MAG: hypothetical protein LC808_03100 [Actinobacteria bacterium]|nr:hypothetical protein [Actinomycetota bacterium]